MSGERAERGTSALGLFEDKYNRELEYLIKSFVDFPSWINYSDVALCSNFCLSWIFHSTDEKLQFPMTFISSKVIFDVNSRLIRT